MHADLLWNKTSVFFAIHFTAYWRSRGVLQSQSWCNIVKILILTFLGPELHTLVIVCLVMLNTSFITIWNRTQNPEDLLISIKAIAQQKSFSTCCHPTLLLGQHSALWNVCCSGYYSSTRLLPFCARTAQHSDIKSPSLRLLAVREKPLGDHFIWRTTLVLHYILGLHVSNNYVLSLLTPSSALRVGPWAWYSPLWYGRLLSHPRFQMPFVQWPGSTVWQLCLPKTEYCC